MKKFLTVLLALSVVFTYSFSAAGAAFAASSIDADKEAKLKAAEAQALVEAERNLNTALTEVSDKAQSGYVIKADAWQKEKAEIWEATKKAILTTTDAQRENYTADSTEISDLVKELYYDENGCNISVAALKAWITDENAIPKKFVVNAALYQFAADYAAELEKFNNVDMSLYSKTVVEPTSEKTYYELAEKYIKEAKDKIATYVEDEAKVKDATNVSYIKAVRDSVVVRTTGVSDDKRFPYLVMTKVGTTDIDSGLYALNPEANLYKTLKIKTIKELEDEGIKDEATAALVKAKIQKMYADYLTTVAKPDKELASAYLTVYNWLADEAVITNPDTIDTAIKLLTNKDDLKEAVKDVTQLNAFAKKYLAEMGADGEYIRNKEVVEKIVKEATTDLYALAAKVKTAAQTNYDSLVDATEAIADAIIANDAYKLDFAKKVAKADLEEKREAALKNYYELEQKAVNAAYDAKIAEVEALKKLDIVNAKNFTVDLAKIKTKSDVDALFANIDSTAQAGATLYVPAHAQYLKAKAYVEFKNKNLTIRDDAYIDDSSLAKEIVTFYGENGARTKSEVEALADKVLAIVDTLPTIGGLNAAKVAAETAIAAIPSKVTAADFEVVKAAWDAAEKYADMMNADNYSDLVVKLNNKAVLDKAVSDLHSAMALELAKKSAAADKNDKAALKAVKAEIDAFNDLHEDDEIFDNLSRYTDTTVQDALNVIRDKELKAVKDAIFAIPLNITEADKATIENARALYDAFVKEYTDYDTCYDAVAEIGYGNLRALTVAETRLAALIADKKIKAVESLKVVKNHSVAGKGYIKIAWSTVGDTSMIDGYRVYRSTKANSGYKYMFKTTKKTYKNTKSLKKGTRYYYKVRAYVEIDGKRYFSDYSNKAYRAAK